MSKRLAIENIYPLAPLQELYSSTRCTRGSGVYVRAARLRAGRAAGRGGAGAGVADVVSRHDALRAGFAWEGLPRPVQVVRRDAELPFRREDLWAGRGRGEGPPGAYLAADRARGFDLSDRR